ncbi:hypothetical protein GPECTOR_15g509 [Gonium pectorale]|uniref:FAD-binding PCMH-type domain-containing protein n=1 Tax=Gonium pectorale TaxID=33097 RepID=A0A150GLV2_GONPE|nr:hypothetical protein GPECTOR_15g509 [Gonium pectorale]|eukprot:KXZ50823.1 hypothetical protein GPECTOR_15g509 [Gonium pectorale]
MDGYVTIDLSNMTQVNLTMANGGRQLTAWTGAGITNSLLVAELLTKGPKGVASLSGSCPSVGTGGFYLGGGMGNLSPLYGLGCDQVLAIEVVLADGSVVTADAEHYPDLFWASCGGGPGFGVITQYKVKVPVHDDPRITSFIVFFPADGGSTYAISSWQKFIAAQNGRNGLVLTGATLLPAAPDRPPVLLSSGMFLGPKEAAIKAINASGLLDEGGVMLDFAPPVEFPTFGHFMIDEYMRLMNDWNSQILVEELGHTWDRSSQAHFDLFVKLALQPGSLVSSAENRFWRWFVMNACYMVPELSPTALKALMAFQNSPTDAECAGSASKTNLTTATDHLCLAKALSNQVTWNHILGGAVAAVPTNATAFPHRKMLSPLCHEPGMPYGTYDRKGELLPSANITSSGGITYTYTPQLLVDAFIKRIQQFQRALLPNTPEIGTYYNYILPSLEDWQRSYWGSNYPRLQRIKAAYDPNGLFSKPFTVELPVRK